MFQNKRTHPFKNAQAALLHAIWTVNGGAKHVAKKLKVNHQAPLNWINRGKVPLKLVPKIAKILNISEWGLNYADLALFNQHILVPEWKEVVSDYGLPKEIIKSILALECPKVKE